MPILAEATYGMPWIYKAQYYRQSTRSPKGLWLARTGILHEELVFGIDALRTVAFLF